ncbi:uncharacterized protein EAE97_001720 [Botrytis byssoidea]|uniref:non-specific serine/threonine protein kinase n=1 Tax=Botrytis byssoidea TaxID=139641 RepID=A0A9P5ISD9_9HELO|nr:uncharacterized protein EAE97_001720 [Botrytis byssoidea]KAF7952223.1 hypothetical protein EAE97_001720 [Botrytis byssoidea]
MSVQHTRPPSRRPLGEATRRVNNNQLSTTRLQLKSTPTNQDSLRQDGLLQVYNQASASPGEQYSYLDNIRIPSPVSNVINPRLSAISKEAATDSKRSSQISTASSATSDGKNLKKFIGPWKLGKTLGEGATARVRLAKNKNTHQMAAIKIVQKRNAQMSQAGSLANLERLDPLHDESDGVRRMPVGIEREVAIMKLIQHPNIMKIYDIWENRTEIYLVLEYVDNGELFAQIANNGRLDEETAMKYFRQLLSALGYCHSYNICHRDLKPENILITSTGDIKVADFGMAALHQGADHKLRTSCGSPHYAAPELIGGFKYRGDKVDIWSMGVILYASLCGRLPFDVEGVGNDRARLNPLLSKIQKGEYEVAPEFSKEAANLISRILQVNPKERITLNQIWKHPVVRKYDYLDNLGSGQSIPSLSLIDCARPVSRRSDIDKDLLRQLWSMWHAYSEEQLIETLLSEKPNEQKRFYTLLLRYRNSQLEDYEPDLSYSNSDYHHIRPSTLTKTYSTCHFPPQTGSSHHRQQASRFTVVSNRSEHTYDPFNASRPEHLDSLRSDDQIKVTVHAPQNEEHGRYRQPSRMSTSRSTSDRGRLQKPVSRVYASRSSLASSTRSRGSAPFRATVGHKRGVEFSHARGRSSSSQKIMSTNGPLTSVGEQAAGADEKASIQPAIEHSTSTRYIRSKKPQAGSTKVTTTIIQKSGRGSLIWRDDVRQLSSSLAKDCDEAFNRTSVVSSTTSQNKSRFSGNSSVASRCPSPMLNVPAKSQTLRHGPFDSRPLPPPPARSDSVKKELLEAREQATLRMASGEDSPGYIDRMVSHIDRLILPPSASPLLTRQDRRAVSAPAETKQKNYTRPLPAINEAYGDELSPRKVESDRIASAPEPRTFKKNSKFFNERETIRVVNASAASFSPVKAPAPLTIRKKSSQSGQITGQSGQESFDDSLKNQSSGQGLRHQYCANPKADVGPELSRIDEDSNLDDPYAQDSNAGTIVKKRSGWFRRNSKASDEGESRSSSILGNETLLSQSSSKSGGRKSELEDFPPIPPTKKKGSILGRLFKKKLPKTGMTVATHDMFDEDMSIQDSIADSRQQSRQNRIHQTTQARQIEPQQNWLAKLFHVKPASKFICFSVSRRTARLEIAKVLKDWKRYGIKDVQVDKQRNIVFGKVGSENFLNLKEVSFAAEILTVFEHLDRGRKINLAVARITQERGAASSFHKVVETLDSVLQVRGVLVMDEEKKRMMVRTVNSMITNTVIS